MFFSAIRLVSDIYIINKIKKIPENIHRILNNLAKDYSRKIPDWKSIIFYFLRI
jgi:hypothetical protein